MTKSEFLQMVEMDRAKKGSGMQNINREDIQRIQHMIPPQKSGGMLKNIASSFGNAIRDVGVGISRGSPDPGAQAIGNAYKMTGEQADQDKREATEILNFLQKEEQARAMQQQKKDQAMALQEHRNAQMEMRNRQMNSQMDYNNRHLTESSRHNLAMEGREGKEGRMSASDRKYEREQEWELKNNKLQEKRPGAVYLDSIPVSERNKYVDMQKNAIKGYSSQKEGIRILEKMKDIVEKHPAVSKYMNGVWGSGKGVAGSLNQLRMSESDRTAVNKYEKYHSDLIKLKIESLAGTGARPNMFLEKIASKTVGELGLTREAQIDNFNHTIGEMKRSNYSKDMVKKDMAGNMRVWDPYSVDAESEEEFEPEQEKSVAAPSLQSIQEAIARKKGMMQ